MKMLIVIQNEIHVYLFILSFIKYLLSSCTMPEMDLWPWYASVNKIKNPTLHVEGHKTPLKKVVNRPLLPKILIYWQFQYDFWNLPKMFKIFFQSKPSPCLKKTQTANLYTYSSFSSVQSLSCVWLFATPWTVAHRPPCLSPTPRACSNSCPSSRWCHPTISSSVIPFSSSVIPFSSCLQVCPASRSFQMSQFFTWSGHWSFSFSISPSNEYSGLISFRIDWLDLLVVQGTLKSLLQHHSSKVSILWHSAFFIVQLSHPYMTTGKTTALTTWTFVGKVTDVFTF